MYLIMLDYRHLNTMTDEEGILQFSIQSIPSIASGYTLDDNARALIVALHNPYGDKAATIYANWLNKAFLSDGSWCNLIVDGVYSSHLNSEDSIGRGLIACSLGANYENKTVSSICDKLFNKILPQSKKFTSPRGIAYALIALSKYYNYKHNSQYEKLSINLANKLISLYDKFSCYKWLWFENNLTYCNGILPNALFSYYEITGDRKALKVGYNSLNFLNDILFSQGYLNIIGNSGWLVRGSTPPLFDQQPVDAASIIFANVEAYRAISEIEYLELATLAYQWYRGKNIHSLSLYNPTTGGCYDALTAEGVNLNQGAESTISLLLADSLMLEFIKKDESIIEKTS